MKKLATVLIVTLCAFALRAQDKTIPVVKAPQLSITTPNYNMKGESGQLMINLPVPATLAISGTRAGEAKILFNWHGSSVKDLPPGNYEITFWNIKFPVAIEKGKDTRILAGVLNSTVKKPWEVWAVGGEKVYGAGGAKMVALPPGKYIIKTGGVEIKTNITDGQTSIFSFTNY